MNDDRRAPPPFQVDGESAWERALACAAEGAVDDGFCLFLEDSESLVVTADSDTEPLTSRSRSMGLAVRSSFEQGRSLYLATPGLEDAARISAVARGERVWVAEPTSPPESLSSEARLDPGAAIDSLATATSSAARLWVEVRWVESAQRIMVARPDRPVAHDLRAGGRVRVSGAVSKGGRRASATVEAVLPENIAGLVEAVAERAEERLAARPAPGGTQTIVLAPGLGGIVAHELIGHALEADTVLANGSWLTEFKEKGRKELGVVDDPRRGRVSWGIDDEGEEPRAVPLFRSGSVAGLLDDLQTARQSGREPSGHGRRSSFREEVKPRMGCTFIAPGDSEPEELAGRVERGLFIRRLESAGTDPATGRAYFRVTDADLIEHGRLGHPLQPHLLLIDGPSFVRTTSGVARDIAFDTCIGSCHRDGQPLPTSVGAPTICIGSASVIY